jgi:hypothetical protein
MSFSQITRGPMMHRVLIWVSGKNRVTGATETAGFWTGGEDRAFTIDGQVRTYAGVGHVIGVPVIASRAGGLVQSQELTLSGTSPEVEMAMRMYDPRLAPVELHVARFNPETGALVGIDRVFKGTVDKAPKRTPGKGQGGASWTVTIVSGARALTRSLTLTRSDASQRAVALPGGGADRFFRHADVAGAVERRWGTARVAP